MPILDWSDAQWFECLSPSQISVLRKRQDERRGSHPLIEESRRGVYVCAGCHNPLFESSGKFFHRDYPSFYESEPGAVSVQPSVGTQAMSYYCARCGGYQGRVYSDGPQPTGKRYANNGEALLFVPRGEKLPPLRT